MQKLFVTSVESLFKEHSFEEIESIRDHLASEIEKRTELLKSIVKEKYHDVVETSGAIQSMKLNLKKVDQSIHRLDKSIADFYERIREPKIIQKNVPSVNDKEDELSSVISKLLQSSSDIWEHFDAGNLKMSVRLYNDSVSLLETSRNNSNLPSQHKMVLDNLGTSLERARQIIKNYLWHRIQSAEPNQVGVIAGSEESDLYQLSLHSSIEFLVERFRKDISDTSYQAQIRRYQPYSYFNTQTNQIDLEVNDLKPPSTSYVQIPKSISIELSMFLYEVCQVINTIAGFSLTRTSILDSLKTTIGHTLEVYRSLVLLVSELKGETRRKRALQLYFDLTYVRLLLNTSKHIELVEELDPRVSELADEFEKMLDSIELYMVSEALHNNALSLGRSRMRLYGLLTPYLQ